MTRKSILAACVLIIAATGCEAVLGLGDLKGGKEKAAALLAQGAVCTSDSECTSAHCADGFCCERACTEACHACSASLTGAANGTCAGATDGSTDPRGQCMASVMSSCGTDGRCQAGACSQWMAGTVCNGSPTCSAGMLTPAATCDGSGHCATTPTSCTPFSCNVAGTACNTACVNVGDCADGFYCQNNSCVADLPAGAPCTSSDVCANQQACAGGYCCKSSCAKTPMSGCNTDGDCKAGTGECALWDASTSCAAPMCANGTETSAGTCDGNGTCVTTPTPCGAYACGATTCKATCMSDLDCNPVGYYCGTGQCLPKKTASAACMSGDECGTGNCTDGVCCDKNAAMCSGCMACNVSGMAGTCSPVKNATDPHGACPTTGCNAGGCNGAGACTPAAVGTQCNQVCTDAGSCVGQCQSGSVADAFCTGSLMCPALGTGTTCSNNLICNSQGTACLTSCSSDGDCVTGYYCKTGTCTQQVGPGATCTASNQCVSGYVCNGTCVTCATGADCNALSPKCNGGGCGQCGGGSDCTGIGAYCNTPGFPLNGDGSCLCNTDGDCLNPRAGHCGTGSHCMCGQTGAMCATNQACTTTGPSGVCKFAKGEPCQQSSDCASGSCSGRACQ